MLEDFVPETELERAYIQSKGWESLRLWRRARLNAEREEWTHAAGLNVSRLLDCALKKRKGTLVGTFNSISFVIEKLNESQRFSLFKCLADLVTTLLDEELEFDSRYTTVILYLMLSLFFRADSKSGANIVCMMCLMDGIFGGRHWLESFSFLASEDLTPSALSEMLETFISSAQESSQRGFFWRSAKADQPQSPDQSEMNTPAVSRLEAALVRQSREDALRRSKGPSQEEGLSLEVREPSHRDLSHKSDKETLALFNELLLEAIHMFGFRSAQTAKALVRIIVFADRNKIMPVNKHLSDLADILEDPAVEIHDFDLRRIYTVTGKIQGNAQFVSTAEQLQRIIFSRREKSLGYDMSMALPLTRLIALWNATGRIEEGQAFCKVVLSGVSEKFSENDIVVRQIKSVYERVPQMHLEKSVPRIGYSADVTTTAAKLDLALYEEPEEFVSMLAIVAMDHLQNSRDADAALVLQEALAYYFECTSDSARRVGEMLWLLIETDLRGLKSFRERLIHLTIPKAFDDYLRRQFVRNFGRLLKLLNQSECAEAIDVASEVTSKSSNVSGVKSDSAPFWYLLLSQGDRAEVFDEIGFENELNQITKYELNPEGQLSKLKLSRANQLGDKLSDHFVELGQPERAREVLTKLLSFGNQTKVDVTKLLTRLARVHIAEDNICDAIAILYLAFSDLPSPYEESGPDEQPAILKP